MRKIQGLILIFFFLNTIYGQDSVRQQAGEVNKLDWEVFPIISYDTDAGFGYGLKGYLKNIFNWQESYDLIIYNSTKGERWYRFQFSFPDYEIRHGKNYGYAFDLIADYDKWISYYFYGLGNNSSYKGREIYTKEPFEFTLLLNKSLSENIIIQGGLIYKTVLFNSFPVQSLPADFSFINKANQLSFLINTIYDTRNSTINPDKGMVISAGFESAPDFSFTNSSFSKISLIFQSYNQIVLPKLILANRISLQQLIGNNIPVQFLLPLGGTQTLRGFSQDRFLDRGSALINLELRYPIWSRFGGIIGVDAGRVFPSYRNFTFNNWNLSPVAGLRFYMNNFVVRADLGISSETIGFYFNFGHIF